MNKVVKVNQQQKWCCINCNWIGTHAESGDKSTIENSEFWLLICPKCEGREFEPLEKRPSSTVKEAGATTQTIEEIYYNHVGWRFVDKNFLKKSTLSAMEEYSQQQNSELLKEMEKYREALEKIGTLSLGWDEDHDIEQINKLASSAINK